MRAAHRISSILKVMGIVLILVSMVFGLYALLNTGSAWRTMKDTGMARSGQSAGFGERFVFDERFLSALSRASGTKMLAETERLEAIRPFFARWFARIEKAQAADEQKTVKAGLNWLQNGMDGQAMLDRLSSMEEMQESQEIREILEYVNGLAAPPKKGKLGNLQAASQEPALREAYEALTAEHGEDAGSWYEFMHTLYNLLQADGSVRDVKAWMGSSLTWEIYEAGLSAFRQAEHTMITDSFSALLQSTLEEGADKGTPDFSAMIESAAATLEERYPGRNLGGARQTKTVLAEILPALLEDESFDGSWGAVADAIRAAAAEDKTESVEAWEQSFLSQVNAEADNRESITVISVFWAVAAKYGVMFLAGIALLILSRLLGLAVTRRLLAARKTAGIHEDPDVLLRVSHLKQYFRSGDAVTKAVDDVSFFIRRGEVFGLVGESGCGKTTTGRTIINLYDPTEGDVYFDGLRISSTQNGLPVLKAQIRQDYAQQKEALKKQGKNGELKSLKREMKKRLREAENNALESSIEKSKCVEFYRKKRLDELKTAYEKDMQSLSGEAAEARTRTYETEKKVAAKDNVMTKMQMIFQDPIASINPRMTVREIIAEGLIIRGITDKAYINQKVDEMLELVGLVREHADRYPHEFSGGQRQRIGIARAIIMEPDLIIADEPISALDVSIQAQVINLLNDLREKMGLTLMFIAHNLSVVKYFSDRIAVMYFGRIVELADSDELFAHPLHPYTKSLLSAIPYPDPHYEKTRQRIEYVPARAHDYSTDQPTLREITPGHYIHCNEAEFARYREELGLNAEEKNV